MPRNPNNSRLVDVTPERLDELAARLRRAAAAISGLSRALQENDQKVIEDVDGNAMLERGFDSISTFVGNCQKKMREF